MLLSDVCISRNAYIGRNSRTEAKIGTEIAHVTRDADTTFKVKRSSGRITQRGLNALGGYSGHERIRRRKVTAMLRLLGGARGTRAPTGEERGGAYCVAMRTACYNSSFTKAPYIFYVCL